MHDLRRFLRLAPAERRLLLRAAAWILVARVGLRVSSLPSMRARFGARARATPAAPPEAIAAAVHGAARRLPGTRCLARSLALDLMLRREGHPSRLRIGVARGDGGALQAHAWIECAGRLLAGESPAGHEPFPCPGER